MSSHVKCRLRLDPIQKIELRRSLNRNGRAQQYLTHQIRTVADPYVPKDEGHLKNTAVETANTITYIQPYAKIQWYQNRGNGLRGKQWVLRAWADHGREIVKSVAAFVGGRSK